MVGPGQGKRRSSQSEVALLSHIMASRRPTSSFQVGTSSSAAPTNESSSTSTTNVSCNAAPTSISMSTDSITDSSIQKRKRGPTRNVGFAKKKQAGEKLLIEISEDDCRVVGKDSKSLIAEGGCVVRKQASLKVAKWADIHEDEREFLRRVVAGSFEIQGNGNAKKVIDAQLNKQYRNYRSRLHIEHYEIHPSLEVALQHPPRGVTMEDWDSICHHFATPEFKKVSDRNKANRAKQNTPHVAGTKSFARLRQEEKAKIGKEPGPIKLYEMTRFSTKKEAWVNQDAKQKHEKMEQLQKESQLEGADSITDEEICLQVLGHKSGYIRGRGAGPKPASSLCNQQVKAELEEYKRRAEQAEQENNEIKQQNMAIQQQNTEMQLEMQEMKASQKRTDEMLQALMEQLQYRGPISTSSSFFGRKKG